MLLQAGQPNSLLQQTVNNPVFSAETAITLAIADADAKFCRWEDPIIDEHVYSENAGKAKNQENRVQKGVFEGNSQRSAGTRQGNYSKPQNTVEPSEIAPWDA
jgi:hypothetical protein